MKKAYIFCQHPIPNEHPNGLRFANLGLILNKLGYEVYLIGCDEKEERRFEHRGIHCYVHDVISGSGFSFSRKREQYRLNYVKNFIEANGIPELVLSGYYNCKAKRYLMRWCKRNKVLLVESIVEWYDRVIFKGVKGFLKFLNDRYFLHIQVPKQKNVIGISTLLCDYYSSRGCNTVYIPTLVDQAEYQGLSHRGCDGVVTIAYAGSPGKKDYIANVICAIKLLSEEERKKICLHLYGATEEQIVSLGIDEEFLKQNRYCIVCHGRIPYADVKGKIADADFTVLLRPNKRYANAGFPTKVGESMACGTPVIANHTSNLDRYVLDGSTGIVCRDETPGSCAEAFRRVIAMSQDERETMRKNALKMAAEAFSYEVYCSDLDQFLKNSLKSDLGWKKNK